VVDTRGRVRPGAGHRGRDDAAGKRKLQKPKPDRPPTVPPIVPAGPAELRSGATEHRLVVVLDGSDGDTAESVEHIKRDEVPEHQVDVAATGAEAGAGAGARDGAANRSILFSLKKENGHISLASSKQHQPAPTSAGEEKAIGHAKAGVEEGAGGGKRNTGEAAARHGERVHAAGEELPIIDERKIQRDKRTKK